ncbi:MAG TPA: methyl-accepting chemotaxis protein [Chitinispirillaceae bacterium]|nr:methyl-accepting chemotaxis protein [Chitinispirillaceae bacterium]
MHDKTRFSFKIDLLQNLVIYPVIVFPLLFYAIKYISLMKQNIGLTLLFFGIDSVILLILSNLAHMNATKKMVHFINQDHCQGTPDSDVRKAVYNYPFIFASFMIMNWLIIPNLFLTIPLYILTHGNLQDLILLNLLFISGTIISLPIAYLIAEKSTMKFLNLEEARTIPEPDTVLYLSVKAKIIMSCVGIICSLLLNVAASISLGNLYNLTFVENIVNLTIIGAEGLLSTIILSWLLANSFSMRLKNTAVALHDIASGKGDLTQRLGEDSNDELGLVARNFNVFVGNLQKIMLNINSSSDTVASSAVELLSSSTKIVNSAEDMSRQSSSVASASVQASANISAISTSAEEMASSTNSVAAAIEQMSTSLNDVSRNCQMELTLSAEANKHSQNSKEIINKLGTAALSIGKVIEVIHNISDQTNLLALNAAIEAARAGDHGKGFSVVASEVKDLALQTTQATMEIKQQIEDMQKSTESAVKVIELVTSAIEEVNTISQNIVGAVEEQSTTINEISKNVSAVNASAREIAHNVFESAKGLSEITENITSVKTDATDTTHGISLIKNRSNELSKLSDNLKMLLGQFKM